MLNRHFILCLLAACGGNGSAVLADPCANAHPTVTTVLANRSVRELQAQGDKLFFVDEKAGSSMSAAVKSGAVFSIGNDGTGETQIYAPTATDRIISDMRTNSQSVVLIEHEIGLTVKDHLVIIPLAGGNPTDTVLSASVERLIAVDEMTAYAWRGENMAQSRKLLRVFLGNAMITEGDTAPNMDAPLFAREAVYYSTQTSLGSNADRTVHRAGTSFHDMICTGDFYAVANGFLCSGFDGGNKSVITQAATDGTAPLPWADVKAFASAPEFLGETNQSTYIMGNTSLVKISYDARVQSAIACSRGALAQRSSHRPDVAIGSRFISWIEGNAIYTAPL